MNFELAKKLKDAGFPVKEELDGFQGATWFTIPTLEELIEACGNDFVTLDKEEKVWEAWGKYYCCDEHGEGRKNERGSTPLIAVANLWLALHRELAPHQEGMIGYIHEREKS